VCILAKLDIPFSDYPVLLDMLTLDGLNVGCAHQSDYSCADTAKHISECEISGSHGGEYEAGIFWDVAPSSSIIRAMNKPSAKG
jgi:hypothetical protein